MTVYILADYHDFKFLRVAMKLLYPKGTSYSFVSQEVKNSSMEGAGGRG
jgi:hypothetical protein